MVWKDNKLPVKIALREQPRDIEPGRVAALLKLLVVAFDICSTIVDERPEKHQSVQMLASVFQSRLDLRKLTIMLKLILQRRKT